MKCGRILVVLYSQELERELTASKIQREFSRMRVVRRVRDVQAAILMMAWCGIRYIRTPVVQRP